MINIVYASQTGTAEDVALQLAHTLSQQCIPSIVASIESVTLTSLASIKYAIFLISTTGDGEPPDSMIQLWNQLLQKSLNKPFVNLKFSVFGFGDSKYGDNFNAMARKLERRLSMLGGEILAERGLGDQQDSMGYRNQYNVWISGLLGALREEEGIDRKQNAHYTISNQTLNTKEMVVRSIDILQEESDRTTFYVEFDTELLNEPGDILTIYPKNKESDVVQLLSYFNLKGDEVLEKQGISSSSYMMFREIINISDTAPYTLFANLDQYIEDEFMKGKLKEMGENYQEYFLYVKQFRRSIREVLQDFPVKLDLPYFLSRINFIKPRKYSIASCQKGVIGLLVRLVQYNVTPYRKIYGAVSKGILDEGKGSKWRGYVTPGKFRFNKQNSYLMVSVGTGVAPFLSFLDHENRKETGLYLNFGNRNQSEFYRKSYIQEKIKEGNLVVKLAFSRIQTNPIHVQQLLKLHKEEVINFFDKTKTKLYICGPYSNFSQSIIVAFKRALQLDDSTILEMKKNSQIVSECW